MCGIVGCIGNDEAREIVLKGLKTLEYRGYDSAGIALYNNLTNMIDVFKDKGRVAHLKDITDFSVKTDFAIGHTRWATHGKVNKANSHPHYSNENRFIIVHNGVIDNYEELKLNELIDKEFRTDTDPKVIAFLLESFAKKMTVEEAIRKTISILEGSYALVIMDNENKDVMYAAKHKSPLLLGIGENHMIVASDVMAMLGYAQKYVALEDKSFIKIKKDEFEIVDIIGKEREYEVSTISVDSNDISKGNYEHYMLKEIDEQPGVIRKIIRKYFDEENIAIEEELLNEIKHHDRIYIIAAGTSMHAGYVGKKLFESLAEIPTEVHIASEFAYDTPIISYNPLFIYISQSGETADSRAVLTKMNKLGYRSLTITNVPTSTLAREANNFLEIFAGPEIAVASTKAYTAQIAILSILAYACSDKDFDLKNELSKVAVAIDSICDNKSIYENVAKEALVKRNCFYIGRGLDYNVALEAALKLKEISYIQTEGFASGELKHGTIALIEQDTPVIGIITQPHTHLNTRSNLEEVRSRGANVVTIATKSLSNENDTIIVDDVLELLTPIVSVVPAQLISYYAALSRGLDIDKPRNLAKSVTVE